MALGIYPQRGRLNVLFWRTVRFEHEAQTVIQSLVFDLCRLDRVGATDQARCESSE